MIDPEFVTPGTARLAGVPGFQTAVDAAVLAVIGAAYWLEMRYPRVPKATVHSTPRGVTS